MEDLQNLLEKINREGIEKADAEARKIVEAAQAKADALVKAAREEADRAKAAAEKDSVASAARAAETIRQAARDVILGVKDSITALLEQLLTKGIDRSLADEKTAADLVATAIRDLTGPGEITCGPKLAAALKAQLAANPGFTIITDTTRETGFTVKLDGGRIEHAFTTEVIASELAKRLRPDLAKLVLGA